ncbi:uncharacterized protein BDR25DRAFT_354223 [Lindgomyces ingoldianus]|uniref:Uncharacterized protein n=1 Tax=Lindgomyces ingoldianus TaxID=673940 RepID=A0ACB6QXM1_9PLEO|nr:uncharacterized protein BDR25DRAFT_354223 [Lindgomyces ingoldianus]KAF2471734.1 hypothetical protein BDR25DRAFT_354223 [Lindgomyces ingoldianus]
MTYPQLRGAYAHVLVTGQRLTTCGPEARDKHDATLKEAALCFSLKTSKAV